MILYLFCIAKIPILDIVLPEKVHIHITLTHACFQETHTCCIFDVRNVDQLDHACIQANSR